MTPAARLSAAMAVLDRWLAGEPAEKVLTNWARASRFAGSGDRAAVRDLVFDAIRCRRSFAHLGGGETGRGLILGGLRAAGTDPAPLFTGQGHAPAPVTEPLPPPPDGLVALDCPDGLAPALQNSLGPDFAPVMQALRQRAPVVLRVNLARATLAQAQAALTAQGIASQPHPLAKTALEVVENARKIQTSIAYLQGLVELQDAASQAVVQALGPLDGVRVLDYCAGGGGKALAMAALGAQVTAHDASAARLRALAPRASRAGARIATTDRPTGRFDLVLVDAPCSGSGAWRRQPEAKWTLTAERLAALTAMQDDIMDLAAQLVRPGGRLAYATCSLLAAENLERIQAFVRRRPGCGLGSTLSLTPLQGGDGFFLAQLTLRQ